MKQIPEDHLVALICEGKSEKTILSILLEDNKLCFSEDQLLDNKIITDVRSAKKFADVYLNFQFEVPIHVVIVQGSKNDLWMKKMSKAYQGKIEEVIYWITSPEIEMLMIHSINCFDKFNKVKSKVKPSQFVKEVLKERNIKTEVFIREFFMEYNLIEALQIYKANTKETKALATIADLLMD